VERESRAPDVIRVIGRYALHAPIAAGGMATVHFGRLLGPVGFSRTVAIKRLHAQYASDPEFVSMFLDEARLAARIRHPNVVPTLDVVAIEGELFLVMDYVPGESLAKLTRGQHRASNRLISATMAGALHGLHAAHEAKDERGNPLGIVHRDVSPQNILVGTDGVPKILDFGVAKASGRTQHTREGQIKGKLSYMPPEQLRGANVTRTTDIYAAGVILWELVTGQRLFGGDNEGVVITKILEGKVTPPSQIVVQNMRGATMNDRVMDELVGLDRLILRALDSDPERRYPTAREMAIDLERTVQPATASEVGEWVEAVAKDVLANRANKVHEIESSTSGSIEADRVMSAIGSKPTLTGVQMQTDPGGFAATMAMPNAPVSRPDMARPSAPRQPIIDATPPVTQPSSISVSAAMRIDALQKHRSAIGAVIGLAIAALLIGGILVFVKVRNSEAGNAPATSSDSPSASMSGQQPQLPQLPQGPVTQTGVEASRDGGIATSAADPQPTQPSQQAQPPATNTDKPSTPPPTGPAPRPTSKPPVYYHPTTPPPPPPPTPSVAPDCKQPFYYDSKGIKKYKENCM
jgi:serine/threonine-protein kinase